MLDIKKEWKLKIECALKDYANDKSLEILNPGNNVLMETPPELELGDISFPMFPFAKDFRESPGKIALEVSKRISGRSNEVKTSGAYINIFINRSSYASNILSLINSEADNYGLSDPSISFTLV